MASCRACLSAAWSASNMPSDEIASLSSWVCRSAIISTGTPPASACLPSASAYPEELKHVAARPGSWVMRSESTYKTPRPQPQRERPQNQHGEGNTIQLQGIRLSPQPSMPKFNANHVQAGSGWRTRLESKTKMLARLEHGYCEHHVFTGCTSSSCCHRDVTRGACSRPPSSDIWSYQKHTGLTRSRHLDTILSCFVVVINPPPPPLHHRPHRSTASESCIPRTSKRIS